MTKPPWDARLARAEELANTYSFAAEMLRFYKEIAGFQKTLQAHLESAHGNDIKNTRDGSLQDQLDLSFLLPKFPPLLSLVERVGPHSLAARADELAEEGAGRWKALLATIWRAGCEAEVDADESELFFARALLQPYAEYLADHTETQPSRYGEPTCPRCGRKPLVGVLRAEGYGAKRSFVCSLCSTEWDYRRIVCPACGEDGFDELVVYTASEFEHVRVEACETCNIYIKAVDLTKNGLAVPVVDELATTPLNLWAEEKGYRKLEPNLLGI